MNIRSPVSALLLSAAIIASAIWPAVPVAGVASAPPENPSAAMVDLSRRLVVVRAGADAGDKEFDQQLWLRLMKVIS
jgi:hypothetical protein